MAFNPEMRASDADREKVAAALREHMVEGRLNAEEFGERLEAAYAAKTFGELRVLTRDLPDIDLKNLPARPEPVKPQAPGAPANLKAAWGGWLFVGGINWAIWLILWISQGELVYPWPLWVMGPWGIGLLIATLTQSQNGDKKRELGS
ncbi:DUF1707 domain-containing protein [Herbidospora sp. NBRC 101105]|uniref:DUF1707 SHOCT-like domain-containing protein n=1 Tax=Herbidospora sp. NBRC 101105 TaxID=3032195 RepID=UPI0024A101EB|nr:DUF1707 domain-containing protein [Herbidospora sp. NBRC 101105]GLX95709.1 hypothetical protein Hesp01_36590 [Herbidospora sp. NBRC 101105]